MGLPKYKLQMVLLAIVFTFFLPVMIFAEGEQYIDSYNELAKAFNERLAFIGTNQLSLKKRGDSVTPQDLNHLRSMIIGLMSSVFLYDENTHGDVQDAENIKDMFWLGIRYEKDENNQYVKDEFGNNKILRPSLIDKVINNQHANAFTKVPGEYVSDGKTIYKNDFNDVPILKVHFDELSKAIAVLKTALFDNISSFDREKRDTDFQSYYHANVGPREKLYISGATTEENRGYRHGNFFNILSICRARWSKPATWVADDGNSHYFAGLAGWSVGWQWQWHWAGWRGDGRKVEVFRKRSRFRLNNPPSNSDDEKIDQGRFYALEKLDKYTSWDTDNEDTNLTKKKVITFGDYTRDTANNRLILNEYIGDKDMVPHQQPPNNPEESTSAAYEEAWDISYIREYIHSLCFIASKEFKNHSVPWPGDADSSADGLLATGCTCTTCKLRIEEEFNDLSNCPEVKFPLGIGNGNIDGLKLLAYISEKNFVWGKYQFYSLDTHIISEYTGNDKDVSGIDHKWSFLEVKHPSGWDVTFDLLHDGKAVNNKEYFAKKNDNGSSYEIIFPQNDGKVTHKYVNKQVVQCRKEIDDEELLTNKLVGIPQWNGLATYYTNGKIDRVECPLGKALPFYNQNNLIYRVLIKNYADEVIQEIYAEDGNDEPAPPYPDDGSSGGPYFSTSYTSIDGAGNLESQTDIIRDLSDNSVIKQIWNIENGAATTVAKTVIRSKQVEDDGTWIAKTVTIIGDKSITDINTYKDFPWGSEMIESTTAAGSESQQVTKYIFYDDKENDGPNYSQLKSVEYHDGSWSAYEYDEEGRTVKQISPFGDTPLNTPEDQCRVTLYSYTPVAPRDVAEDRDFRTRTIIEKVKGVEVSRSYNVYFPTETRQIRAASPDATWDDPNNLVTISEAYHSGDFQGRPHRTINSDGIMSVMSYSISDDSLITTVESGAGTDYTVTDGTRSITETDARGNTVYSETFDIASSLRLSSATYTRDDFGRVTRVDYLDGTHTATVYGCCGPETQTNREGTVTTTSYDTLKRLSDTSTAGITTIYAYDVNGYTTSTTRKGPDGTEITTSSFYNAAGELISSTDALGNTTEYKEDVENGSRVTTTMYPDGSTSIQVYNRDGSLIDTQGSAVHGVTYEYGIENGELYKKTYPADTPQQWVKTFTDFLGRSYKTVFADDSESVSYYDSASRPVKQVGPNGRTTLTAYNAKGDVEATALDLNNNGVIDYTNSDRVEKYVNSITPAHGTTVYRRETLSFPENNDTPLQISVSETSVDGLQSWNTSFGRTSHSQTVYNGGGQRTVTTTNPDGSRVIQIYQDGRLTSSNHSVLGETTYTYDGHGRLKTEVRTENGQTKTTSYSYNHNDQTVAIIDPAGRNTTHKYDNMSRRTETTLPSGRSVHYQYFPTGELKRTFGANTYPVSYTYDDQGRMKALSTYKDFPNSADVTTWNYDPLRGHMISKIYADGKGTSYTYNPDGSLATRTWARNTSAGSSIVTTYTYDNASDLASVSYNDTFTPGVTYTRDRLGRIAAISHNNQQVTITYNPDGTVNTSTVPHINGSPVLSYTYDPLGRRSGLTLADQQSAIVNHQYTYDTMSRLATVGNGSLTATYTRIPGTSLLNTTIVNNGTGDIVSVKRSYDTLNRLTSISTSSLNSQSPIASFQYHYDDNDRRVKSTLADGSYWLYKYDEKGQLLSGKKFTPNGKLIPGQSFNYDYDTIGNRISSSSSSSSSSSYSTNNLNQYTSRTAPNEFTIAGEADSSEANVAILDKTDNTASIPDRLQQYFWKLYTIDNSTEAVRQDFDVYSSYNDQVNLKDLSVFVPQNPVAFVYDEGGNLLQDGRLQYQWDAENRLMAVFSKDLGLGDGLKWATFTADDLPDPSIAQDNDVVALFDYDYMGRRTAKKVYEFVVILSSEGDGGGYGWIEDRIKEIEEKLAEKIVEINEKLAKKITHFEEQKLKIQNNPRIPPKVKAKRIAKIDRQITRAQENAQKKIEHEQEKAAKKIARLETRQENKIATLQKKVKHIERSRDKTVAAIDKTIEKLQKKKPRNYEKIIAKLETAKQKLIDKAAERIAKIQARIDELQNGGGGEPTPEVREWRKVCDEKLVYDGWNVIAIYDVTEAIDPDTEEVTITEALGKSLLWGEDSGGGVGGLIAVSLHSVDETGNAIVISYLPAYDGNFNIVNYLDSDTGTTDCVFEYSPFGGLIIDSDEEYKFKNRFSTKQYDKYLKQVHYQFRDYKPETGRWVSRDMIAEEGGFNVYGFINNNAVKRFDLLGLLDVFLVKKTNNGYRKIESYISFNLKDVKIDDSLPEHVGGTTRPTGEVIDGLEHNLDCDYGIVIEAVYKNIGDGKFEKGDFLLYDPHFGNPWLNTKRKS